LIRKHIPNFITLLNLFSGSIAIVFAFKGNLMLASWFIGFAAIFDFLDGMAARLLNARSAIGLQLDSLADLISFGLAPGVIVYQLMYTTVSPPFLYFNGINVFALLAFIIPVFSALRLAKFNIDESQTSSFRGLPTPANALFFASLPLVIFQAEQNADTWITFLSNNYWVLAGTTILFSLLMVSNVHLFSLKLKNFKIKENLSRYTLLLLGLVLLFFLKYYALPLIVVSYTLISLIENTYSTKS
jgi:CDP-diacylglycerol--serine O-phosphatidyltransferase